MNTVEEFRTSLLEWYSIKKRQFPWRDTTEPYAVLVTELLLQKTNAEKVEPIYLEFMRRFPTIRKLQRASTHEIAEVIAPLGLFYRAVRISRVADAVANTFDGVVPNTPEELLMLPGVGSYMMNAVLCFAFGQPRPLIDTNSARVLTRVFGLSPSKTRPRTDRQLWAFASSLVPASYVKEYNWALIDLAHLVCMPAKQLHTECPVRTICSVVQEQELHESVPDPLR